MIYQQTRLRVADNTGAREIMCIRVLAGCNSSTPTVGDIIVAVGQAGRAGRLGQEGRGRRAP